MNQFVKKYWLVILLAFAASALVVFKLLTPSAAAPTVVSIVPAEKIISPGTNQIVVTFDQPVENLSGKITLFSTPALGLGQTFADNQLIVNFQKPLSENTKYLFEVRFNNFPLTSWSYQTSAKPAPAQVESERGDPKAREEIIKETLDKYPLIAQLPYETEECIINYSAPLTLVVKIKKGDRSKIKWAIFDWLKENQVDPDSHKIEWLE